MLRTNFAAKFAYAGEIRSQQHFKRWFDLCARVLDK